jgi:hypothetical protein
MSVTGIYPASLSQAGSLHSGSVNGNGPQLSDHEAALLAALPEKAQKSRLATHAELHAAVIALASRKSYTLELQMVGNGFSALVAHDLRVVANVRGTGEETFYCQASDADLLRQLAEEIARTCGPQLLLPANGEDGTLVIAPDAKRE